jgi:acyl-coenzyme A synthetase/AMP-(fatty) acid ligase
LYGPAETTTACAIHRVTLDDVASGTIPIGVGLAGTTIHVLDPELREVPVGQTGEIYVAGPGVTRGYLSSPELTAERFPVVPIAGVPTRMYRTGDLARRRDDGRLLFVGRVDRQVKIRGYRVEPGEVEQALLRYSGVSNAAVLADGEGDDRRLVAFVVLSDGLDAEQVRFRAERDLPAFMVPSEFLVLDELPFTEHGKREIAVLREMLARHRASTEAAQEPQSDTERYLVGLWEELFLVDGIGRDDDFYAVGGHSLLAFRMIERIGKDLDIRLEFETVLDTPVLKDLAAEMDAARVEVGR